MCAAIARSEKGSAGNEIPRFLSSDSSGARSSSNEPADERRRAVMRGRTGEIGFEFFRRSGFRLPGPFEGDGGAGRASSARMAVIRWRVAARWLWCSSVYVDRL